MLPQVSGRFPVAEDRGNLQGQSATIERSNGKRGLIAFNFPSPWEGLEVESEKKTNAHHV